MKRRLVSPPVKNYDLVSLPYEKEIPFTELFKSVNIIQCSSAGKFSFEYTTDTLEGDYSDKIEVRQRETDMVIVVKVDPNMMPWSEACLRVNVKHADYDVES